MRKVSLLPMPPCPLHGLRDSSRTPKGQRAGPCLSILCRGQQMTYGRFTQRPARAGDEEPWILVPLLPQARYVTAGKSQPLSKYEVKCRMVSSLKGTAVTFLCIASVSLYSDNSPSFLWGPFLPHSQFMGCGRADFNPDNRGGSVTKSGQSELRK